MCHRVTLALQFAHSYHFAGKSPVITDTILHVHAQNTQCSHLRIATQVYSALRKLSDDLCMQQKFADLIVDDTFW